MNAVGVDVNTASPALLSRVAGVGPLLSENIVAYRNEHGPFNKRSELKKVPRLGAKAFEQCAGFLRITGGAEPLDASSVHPEAYPVARKILAAAGNGPAGGSYAALNPQDFVDGAFGLPTVRDIIAELEKPGRDPRPAFAAATFSEGIEKISDLRPGHDPGGNRDQRGGVRCVRRRRRPPGRAGARLGAGQPLRLRSARSGEVRAGGPGQGARGGSGAEAHFADAEARRRTGAFRRSTPALPGDARRRGRSAAGARVRPQGAGSPEPRSRTSEQPTSRSQRPRSRRSSQPRSAQPKSAPGAAPANTAMAEALRRAGLGK